MKSFLLSAIIALTFTSISAAPVQENGLIKRGDNFKGTATWYKPATEGGSEGACHGVHIDNNSPYVALNRPQYGNLDSNSKWCGKKIKITGPAGTATATIMDACPECDSGDLDLTPSLFKKVVGDMNKGVGSISWEVV